MGDLKVFLIKLSEENMTDKFKDPMKPKFHPKEHRNNDGIVKPLVEGIVGLALVGGIVQALKK